MAGAILTINAGSSSLKSSVFAIAAAAAEPGPRLPCTRRLSSLKKPSSTEAEPPPVLALSAAPRRCIGGVMISAPSAPRGSIVGSAAPAPAAAKSAGTCGSR